MRGGYRKNAGRKQGFAAKNAEEARKLLSERLAQEIEPIADVLISQAKKGDIRAIKELFDRAWGKTPQNERLQSAEQINGMRISFDPSFKDMSDDLIKGYLSDKEKDGLRELIK
jgi:hypothetical protein